MMLDMLKNDDDYHFQIDKLCETYCLKNKNGKNTG